MSLAVSLQMLPSEFENQGHYPVSVEEVQKMVQGQEVHLAWETGGLLVLLQVIRRRSVQ